LRHLVQADALKRSIVMSGGVAIEEPRSLSPWHRRGWRARFGDNVVTPGGRKSLCIFRREADGIWRADVDIFNAVRT
jgi:hypothetical protein